MPNLRSLLVLTTLFAMSSAQTNPTYTNWGVNSNDGPHSTCNEYCSARGETCSEYRMKLVQTEADFDVVNRAQARNSPTTLVHCASYIQNSAYLTPSVSTAAGGGVGGVCYFGDGSPPPNSPCSNVNAGRDAICCCKVNGATTKEETSACAIVASDCNIGETFVGGRCVPTTRVLPPVRYTEGEVCDTGSIDPAWSGKNSCCPQLSAFGLLPPFFSTLIIDVNVVSIPSRAFTNCDSYIGQVYFEPGPRAKLAVIGDAAFENMTSAFTGVALIGASTPALSDIGVDAFKHTNLKSIAMPQKLLSLGSGAFMPTSEAMPFCKLCPTQVDWGALCCNALTGTSPGGNEIVDYFGPGAACADTDSGQAGVQGCAVFNYARATDCTVKHSAAASPRVCCSSSTSAVGNTLVIAADVERVEDAIFSLEFCPGLSHVIFAAGSSVVRIGKQAFDGQQHIGSQVEGLDLTSLSKLRFIETNAFRLCNIALVKLPSSIVEVQHRAFSTPTLGGGAISVQWNWACCDDAIAGFVEPFGTGYVCPTPGAGGGHDSASANSVCDRSSGWFATLRTVQSCASACAQTMRFGAPGLCDAGAMGKVSNPLAVLRVSKLANSGVNPCEGGALVETTPSLTSPLPLIHWDSTTDISTAKCFYGNAAPTTCDAVSGFAPHWRRVCCCKANWQDGSSTCPVAASDCLSGQKFVEAIGCVAYPNCPAGSWTDAIGATCVPCTAGTFGPFGGRTSAAEACLSCPHSTIVGTARCDAKVTRVVQQTLWLSKQVILHFKTEGWHPTRAPLHVRIMMREDCSGETNNTGTNAFQLRNVGLLVASADPGEALASTAWEISEQDATASYGGKYYYVCYARDAASRMQAAGKLYIPMPTAIYTITSLTSCAYNPATDVSCCPTQKVVAIDASVEQILSGSCEKCENVMFINFDYATSVTKISPYAFSRMSTIGHLDLSQAKALQFIGRKGFSATPLTMITLSPTVKMIIINAFDGTGRAVNLPKVNWNGVKCTEVVSSCNQNSATLGLLTACNGGPTPDQSAYTGSEIWDNQNCPSQECSPSNTADTCFLSSATPACESIVGGACCAGTATTVVIEADVVSVPTNKFRGCVLVKSVSFQAGSLASIGAFAFYGTSISEVDVSAANSLATIDAHAFQACSYLAKVTLVSSITRIGSQAFSGAAAALDPSVNVAWAGVQCLTSQIGNEPPFSAFDLPCSQQATLLHRWNFAGMATNVTLDTVGGVAATLVNVDKDSRMGTGIVTTADQGKIMLGDMTWGEDLTFILNMKSPMSSSTWIFECEDDTQTGVRLGVVSVQGKNAARAEQQGQFIQSSVFDWNNAATVGRRIQFVAMYGTKMRILVDRQELVEKDSQPIATKKRSGCRLKVHGEITSFDIWKNAMTLEQLAEQSSSENPLLEWDFDFTKIGGGAFSAGKWSNRVAHSGVKIAPPPGSLSLSGSLTVLTKKGYYLPGNSVSYLDVLSGEVIGGAFTIIMTARVDSLATNMALLSCVGATPGKSFELHATPTRALDLRVDKVSVGETRSSLSPTGILKVKERTHIVATIGPKSSNPADIEVLFYVNGVKISPLTNPAGNTLPVAVMRTCRIGSSSAAAGLSLKGEVSAFRFYHGTMSEAQVGALYATAFPFKEHAWSFQGPSTKTNPSKPKNFVDVVADTDASPLDSLSTLPDGSGPNIIERTNGVQFLTSTSTGDLGDTLQEGGYLKLETECRNLGGSIDVSGTKIQLTTDDAAACSSACSDNANCKLWVFYTDTYPVQAQAKSCFLTWDLGLTYSVAAGTTISGAQGCEGGGVVVPTSPLHAQRQLGGPMTVELVTTLDGGVNAHKATLFDCGGGAAQTDRILLQYDCQVVMCKLYWKVGSGADQELYGSTRELQGGIRYQIVATVTWGKMNIYVNGIEHATKAAVNIAPPNTASTRTKCYVGKSNVPAATAVYFPGHVASLKLYSGYIAAGQAAAQYKELLPQLKHFWDFRNAAAPCSSGVAYVDSVSNKTATLSGMSGAGCKPYGIVLVGQNFIALESIGGQSSYFGGSMSIEMVVEWSSVFASHSRLFDCGIGQQYSIILNNKAQTGVLRFLSGSTSVQSATAVNLNVKHHIVATMTSARTIIYVDGIVVANSTTVGNEVVTSQKRTDCYIGKSNSPNDQNFRGIISYLKIYAGAMRQAQVTAAFNSMTPGSNTADSIATPTPTGSPTSTPTSSPSSLPTTSSPSSAPTASPTHVLGNLVEFSHSMSVNEDGVESKRLLSVRPGTIASDGETITVECAADLSNASFSNAAPIVITSGGVQGGRTGFDVRGVWDNKQLPSRMTNVACSVSSTVPSKMKATLSISLTIVGIAQPSIALFCPITNATLKANTAALATAETAQLQTCATTLTTSGGTVVVLIGGECDQCPQPPFDMRTKVRINGLDVANAEVLPGGKRLRFIAPAVTSGMILGAYYPISVTTHVAASGNNEVTGAVSLGPGASTIGGAGGDSSKLACALSSRPLCPPGTPSSSGVFYTDICDNYLNPALDMTWNVTRNGFAYGVPPGCRDCPVGCRCPGGERCHADPGFFVDGEKLPGENEGPARCALPALVRCKGYAASLGGTLCGQGYAGSGCGSCSKGWHLVHGICAECENESVWDAFALPLAVNGIAVVAFFPLLALIKLIIMMISHRLDPTTDNDCSFKAFAKDAGMCTLKFVVAAVSSMQIVASVTSAAAGDAPPAMESLNSFTAIFHFKPPLVHPACVTDAKLGLGVEYAMVCVGLVAACVDIMSMQRYFRLEQICCGWTQLCGKVAHDDELDVVDNESFFASLVSKARLLLRRKVTPYFRYGLSTCVCLIYVVVVDTSIEMLTCRPSAALDQSWGLRKDPTVQCFTALHLPLFMLSICCVAVVGLLWPLAWLVTIVEGFALRKKIGCCNRINCVAKLFDRCCDRVEYDEAIDNLDASIAVEGARQRLAEGKGIPLNTAADLKQASSLRTSVRDQMLQFGFSVRVGKNHQHATLVDDVLLMKGGRGKAYLTFLDTPFEAHFFWLVILRLYTMMILSVLRALFVVANPTHGTSISLFLTTNLVMLVFTSVTVGVCPYHRASRWHALKNIAVLGFTLLASASNLCLSIDELDPGSNAREVAAIIASLSAIFLPAALVFMLIAFLFGNSFGACARCGCACTFLRRCLSDTDHSDDVKQRRSTLARRNTQFGLDISLESAGSINAGESFRGMGFGRAALDLALEEGGHFEMTSFEGGASGIGTVTSAIGTVTSPVAGSPFRALATGKGRIVNPLAALAASGRAASSVTSRDPPAVFAESPTSLFTGVNGPRGDGSGIERSDSEALSTFNALPEGWAPVYEGEEPNQTVHFYHHDESGASVWLPPTDAEAAAAIAEARAAADEFEELQITTESSTPVAAATSLTHSTFPELSIDTRPRSASPLRSSSSPRQRSSSPSTPKTPRPSTEEMQRHSPPGRNFKAKRTKKSRSAGGGGGAQRARPASRKFVKRTWKPRDDATLADVLIVGTATSPSRSGHTRLGVPRYLEGIFDAIFAAADTDGDGTLSTLELMRVLKTRAKHTALRGDAHAIFTLKTLMASQAKRKSARFGALSPTSPGAEDDDEEHDIGPEEFASGLLAAMKKDPNGSVSQWIIKELQNAAALWEEVTTAWDEEGNAIEVRWFHTETNETVDEMPQLLWEVQRCDTELAGNSGGVADLHEDTDDDDVAS